MRTLNQELGARKAAECDAQFIAVDVTDETGVMAAIEQAEAQQGKARILVQAIIENPMLNGESIRLHGAIRMAPK